MHRRCGALERRGRLPGTNSPRRDHIETLISHGVIGKGTEEMPDMANWATNKALMGFHNSILYAVGEWIRSKGLKKAAEARSNAPRM